ncbi:MAG: N-acetylmuramoyl-L-alanine amidase, partial [Clostridiales bacterium]|nr:N-acetylmuramoyl-L-alanine amidase [Clostridiales bacterium]
MTGNRKKGDLPVTGILAVVVVLLAVVLALLVSGYRRISRDRQGVLLSETETAVDTSQTEPVSEISVEISMESTEETVVIIGESETDADTVLENAGEKTEDTETETETEAEKLTVAIDPGHQGSWVDMTDTEPLGPGSSEMKTKSSTGTQGSYSGLAEYELNLEIALLLRTELEERGYAVILTREDNDTAISNAERATLACEQGGDIYVRIHANGSEDSSVSGALAMVPSSSNPYVAYLAEDSYLLAECILEAYCNTAGFQSLGIQYTDTMTGINWSQIPVMILEMGFMTNESDDLRMADASVQEQMVQGIADGIDDYFIQKGQKTTETEAEAESESESETVSAEAELLMNSLMEMLGERYLYPSESQGEAWAVSVKSLDDGSAGDINGDVQMKSASVMKAFIMAVIYDRVYFPSSEERRIEIEESYEGELEELITAMITVSDNTASNTLVTMLGSGDAQAGMDVVNQFLEENDYTGTHMGRLFLEENPSGDNYTTTNDCCALLESIYTGTCVG